MTPNFETQLLRLAQYMEHERKKPQTTEMVFAASVKMDMMRKQLTYIRELISENRMGTVPMNVLLSAIDKTLEPHPLESFDKDRK